MPEPIRPSELEEVMKDVVNVPEPDAEFMNSLRARFIAEGHASAKKNQETQMKKIFSRRLTWALVVLVLVSLVVLFTRPTVVIALKRLFGYVPGVGIVDQSSGLRVLSEPITITREGVTANIEQAVLNKEKTVIVYSYIISEGYAFDPTAPNTVWDERTPFLSLPDGSRFDLVQVSQTSTMDCPQCAMRFSMEFAAIPEHVMEVTLELPSLTAVPVGAAPQDWKFSLKFKVADPADIAPVIEQVVTPVPTAAGSEVSTLPVIPYGITNNIDKFVALPDGYILYGSTAWTDPQIKPYGVFPLLASIKDAAGTEIPFEYADAGIYSEPDELRVYWAYKIGSTFTAPLTLSFAMTASIPADGGSFIFDPGPNPQLGQKWDINQDVTVNGEVIQVLTAEEAGIEPGYFMFAMQSDSNIVGAAIADLNYPMMGGGGGGGGMPGERVPFFSGFGYQVPIPQGPLTMTFINIEVVVSGDWTLTWSP